MAVMKNYSINIEGYQREITVTAVRTENDLYGNPNYLVQVWVGTETKHIWYPKLKGYRDRKDETYKMQSYNLEDSLKSFVKQFETELNERLQWSVK